MTKDEKFMRMAIDKALKAIKKGQTPFGACITKNNKAIVCEHNTVWKDTDITSHGEIHAIRKACKKLKTVNLAGCTIYSTCEPCPMCFSACHWAKISKIVYGASIKDAEKAGFKELKISNIKMKKEGNSKIKIENNCIKNECKELFTLWKSQNPEGKGIY